MSYNLGNGVIGAIAPKKRMTRMGFTMLSANLYLPNLSTYDINLPTYFALGVIGGLAPLNWSQPLLQLYLFYLVSDCHLVNLGSAAGALDEGLDSALFGPSNHAIGTEVVVASGPDYVGGLDVIKAYSARGCLIIRRRITAGDDGL